MEKTKFELECEKVCAKCMNDGFDICNMPGHCREDVEMARCGICGNIYCSDEAMTEHNICACCASKISRNVDANNEIINADLFNRKYQVIKSGQLYEIPVASKVQYKDKVLECCPGTCCADCYLNLSNECNAFVCHSDNREDKTEVVFKLVKN